MCPTPTTHHQQPTNQSTNPSDPLLHQQSNTPTFTLYIRRHRLPIAQSNPRNLALGRVWFFGLHGADFEADAFELGAVGDLGGDQLARFLGFAAAVADLVEGGVGGGGCAEGADSRGGEAGGQWGNGMGE